MGTQTGTKTRTLTDEEWAIVLDCLTTEEEAARQGAEDDPEDRETLLEYAADVQALLDKVRK